MQARKYSLLVAVRSKKELQNIPGDNATGPVVEDEEVFAPDIVIGVVVADTHENAKLAARKVVIEYEVLPPILSIKDAVKSKSFFPNSNRLLGKGDVDLCFQSNDCDKIIEGEVHVAMLAVKNTFIWSHKAHSFGPWMVAMRLI
ncbi:hypothetical protein L2E82_07674 [Cichorium intybus]|uniref:Uncharacterized protein n=1 Tax=Cichorium intybus TaxID=13427 RepID=A0ACB9G4R3_CICIN|nr:hypothetical protein L2E82_07674 [Cichorium intybus]